MPLMVWSVANRIMLAGMHNVGAPTTGKKEMKAADHSPKYGVGNANSIKTHCQQSALRNGDYALPQYIGIGCIAQRNGKF